MPSSVRRRHRRKFNMGIFLANVHRVGLSEHWSRMRKMAVPFNLDSRRLFAEFARMGAILERNTGYSPAWVGPLREGTGYQSMAGWLGMLYGFSLKLDRNRPWGSDPCTPDGPVPTQKLFDLFYRFASEPLPTNDLGVAARHRVLLAAIAAHRTSRRFAQVS